LVAGNGLLLRSGDQMMAATLLVILAVSKGF